MPADQLDRLLDELLDAYFPPETGPGSRKITEVLPELAPMQAIRTLGPEDRAEVALRALERIGPCRQAADRSGIRATWKDKDWIGTQVYRFVAHTLLAAKLPFSDASVLRIVRSGVACGRQWNEYFLPLGRMSTVLLRFAEHQGIPPTIEIAARNLLSNLDGNSSTSRFRARIETALRVGPRRRAELTAPRATRDTAQGEGSPECDMVAAAHLEHFLQACEYRRGLDREGARAAFERIAQTTAPAQRAFIQLGLQRIAAIPGACGYEGEQRFWHLVNYQSTTPWAVGLSECLAKLLYRKLGFEQEDLLAYTRSCAAYGVVSDLVMPHVRALCSVLEHRFADDDPPAALKEAIALLALAAGQKANAPEQRLRRRLATIARGRQPLPLRPGAAWSDRSIADLGALAGELHVRWVNLIEHCTAASGASPPGKWHRAAMDLLTKVGRDRFEYLVASWFDLVDKPRTQPAARPHEWAPDPTHLIDDANADILKGLCWIAGTIESPDLARALGRLAISCYRKVPGIGPRAVKIGNAAVYALGQMPGGDSLGQLAMLRVKVKFGTAQKLIEKALGAAAEREGLPREEIDELGVPSYGLTGVGLRREPMGDYTAELRVEGFARPVLGFLKPDGKPQKSVPAAIRETHAADLKELKAAAKDIGAMLPAQRDRIDGLFLEDKSWDLPTWRERYLDHPLVGVTARRLLWRFARGRDGAWDAGAPTRSAVWLDGVGLVGLDAEPVELDDPATRVRLWHPIEVEQAEILAWREFLERRQLVQPFKQAHREVYLLTDAERNTGVYSNRYAAHVLRQHQFNALCAARRWKNKLRLLVDDEFPPATRTLPAWNLRAEFWIEGAGEDYGNDTNEAGVFNYLITDQVRFYGIGAAPNTGHAGGGGFAMRAGANPINEPLPLEGIPPLVLSEIMRDVDLFVGVTSVGNNPAWQDGGPEGRYRDYWWSYSFGDLSGTAETRRHLLERLVPRLKIADRCTIDGRFLTVRGDLRTYKIHLGSGNILMEPNDQYLCIVASSRADPTLPPKLYLPFEGDRTLAIILSKAFLLADDSKITDRTITSQIGRKS